MPHLISGRLLRGLASAVLLLAALLVHAEEARDYSAAEQMLFMDEHLRNVDPPQTLRYAFHRSGSEGGGFEDTVTVTLAPQADGQCCIGTGEFLSGERRLWLPDVEGARANPVILYFLEHDVRDMNRRTQGQQRHFRQRIRMAVYKQATVREASYEYRGQRIAGHEITITPYLDDPQRHRFETLAGKQYVFMLSEAVPGGVYGLRTRVGGAAAEAPPLIVEELFIEGAAPAAQASTR